jgi:hypothetical protein
MLLYFTMKILIYIQVERILYEQSHTYQPDHSSHFVILIFVLSCTHTSGHLSLNLTFWCISNYIANIESLLAKYFSTIWNPIFLLRSWFFFNMTFLLILYEFHIMHPSLLSSSMSASPTLVTSPPKNRKKREKNKTKQVYFVLSIDSIGEWSKSQQPAS